MFIQLSEVIGYSLFTRISNQFIRFFVLILFEQIKHAI